MEITSLNVQEFSNRAHTVYEKIRQEVEATHQGKFLAIEPDSGEYFLGDNELGAIKHGKAKHPDKLFYLFRVGYRAVHRHV